MKPRFTLAILVLVAGLSAAPARLRAVSPAPADSLGIRDLLDLSSASIQDLSPDGRWLAVTISVRRDALGTDYYRDNDPTYLRAPLARLLVVDTKTGAQRAVLLAKKTVRNVTWSPDGARLAMFIVENDALVLNVWDRSSGKLTTMKLPAAQFAAQYIAENSELRWTGDGKQVVFALRTAAWKTESDRALHGADEGAGGRAQRERRLSRMGGAGADVGPALDCGMEHCERHRQDAGTGTADQFLDACQ